MAIASTKNEYINLFRAGNGTLTAGGTDGWNISSGNGLSPLEISLDASKNETTPAIPLAIRCEEGYQTIGDTTISFTGEHSDKWSLSKTADGTFGNSITITDEIFSKNVLFYVKASSSSDEKPMNDTSTSIQVKTKIATV